MKYRSDFKNAKFWLNCLKRYQMFWFCKVFFGGQEEFVLKIFRSAFLIGCEKNQDDDQCGSLDQTCTSTETCTTVTSSFQTFITQICSSGKSCSYADQSNCTDSETCLPIGTDLSDTTCVSIADIGTPYFRIQFQNIFWSEPFQSTDERFNFCFDCN